MIQVAARISEENERWLKDCFRTKSAGAEFILPWAMNAFKTSIAALKDRFTAAELKVIVDAYRGARVTPDMARASYVLLRLKDACARGRFDERYPVSMESLWRKLAGLDDVEAAALMVWASGYWVSRTCSADSLDEYIRDY